MTKKEFVWLYVLPVLIAATIYNVVSLILLLEFEYILSHMNTVNWVSLYMIEHPLSIGIVSFVTAGVLAVVFTFFYVKNRKLVKQ
jgi:hypothetical protein